MKKLMNIVFLSCLKATELIEKKLNFKLSLKEKLQLRMHKMMCEACTNYEKQSKILDQALGSEGDPTKLKIDLADFKKNIIARLEESDRS